MRVYAYYSILALAAALLLFISREGIRVYAQLPGLTPSSSCSTEMCVELLSHIRAAQNSIDLAIYGVRNQPILVDALQAARSRGVIIRSVVDADATGANYYSDTGVLSQLGEVRTDFQVEKQRASFSKDRVAIMHNKFVVIDSSWVWTGSANVSDSCIGGYNANVSVGIQSATVAKWYTDEFNEMFERSRFHELKTIHTAQERLQTTIGSAHVSVYFSPQGNALSAAILPAISNAQKSVYAAIFYVTSYEVVQELVDAKNRGLDVKVIADASAVESMPASVVSLRSKGVQVRVENWGGKQHAKTLIVDNSTLITGSMNWTTAGAFHNDENTVVINNAENLAQKATTWFIRMWQSIPLKWQTASPSSEGTDSPNSCTDGLDNNYDGKTDVLDARCKMHPTAVNNHIVSKLVYKPPGYSQIAFAHQDMLPYIQ